MCSILILATVATPIRAQTLQPPAIKINAFTARQVERLAESAEATVHGDSSRTSAPWTAALRFAKESHDSFVALLKLAQEYPRAFAALSRTDDQSAKDVSLALLTTNIAHLSTSLAGITTDSGRASAATAADKLHDILKDDLDALAPHEIAEVALDGNIRGLAASKTENSSAATGSFGIRIVKEDAVVAGQVNVASTVDTLIQGFAATILSPGTGGALSAGLVDVQLRTRSRYGWHLYGSVSKGIWHDTTTVSPPTPTTASVTVVGLGLLVHRDIVTDHGTTNRVAFSVEAGPTMRVIGGDIANHKALRRALLNGSTKTSYFGGEAGFQLGFNSVTGGFQLYYLFGRRVDGLTQLQATAGLSLHGTVFTKALDNIASR